MSEHPDTYPHLDSDVASENDADLWQTSDGVRSLHIDEDERNKRSRASPTTPMSGAQAVPGPTHWGGSTPSTEPPEFHRCSTAPSSVVEVERPDGPTPEGSVNAPSKASVACRRAVPKLCLLPVDVRYQILLYLPTKDIMRSVARVDRSWAAFCQGKCLWRLLTYRCYPVTCAALESYCAATARAAASGTQPCACVSRPAMNVPTSPWSTADRPRPPRTAAIGSALRQPCCPLPATCCSNEGTAVLEALDETLIRCLFDQHVLCRCGCAALQGSGLVHSVRWSDAYHNMVCLGRIAVCDQRNNRVKQLRLDGTLLDILDEDSGMEIATPSGIVLLPSGCLAITEFHLHTIAILDPAARRVVRRFPVGYLPRALAVLPNGNLIVCIFGGSQVKVYTPEGECVHVIRGRFQGPSGVAVLPGDRVAVTECNGNRVVILKLAPSDGDDAARNNDHVLVAEVQTIVGTGEYGDGDDELAEPRGIAFLPKEGNIAVCDSGNARLQIFTLTGVLVRTIHGPFECLASVSVLSDGHHAVVSDCDHHRLIVLRLHDGKLLHQIGTGDAGSEPDELSFPRCIAVLPGLI